MGNSSSHSHFPYPHVSMAESTVFSVHSSNSSPSLIISRPDRLVADLYDYLNQCGSEVVHPSGTLMLTTNTLSLLCKYLDSLPKRKVDKKTTQTIQTPINSGEGGSNPQKTPPDPQSRRQRRKQRKMMTDDWFVNLEYIGHVLQAIHSLQIDNPNGAKINGFVDVGRFGPHEHRGRLSHLELRNIPIKLVKNLRALREVLIKLSVFHCLQNVRSLLELCGADESYPSSWTALRYLDLRCNCLSMLDDSLRLLPNLRILDLSRNCLSECRGLEHLVSLESLNLSFNFLTQIPKLNDKVNKEIKSLLISFNALENTQGVSGMHNLQVLDVSYNCILSPCDLVGVRELIRLQKIRVFGNPYATVKGYRRSTLEMLSECVPVKFQLDDTPLSNSEMSQVIKKEVTVMEPHAFSSLDERSQSGKGSILTNLLPRYSSRPGIIQSTSLHALEVPDLEVYLDPSPRGLINAPTYNLDSTLSFRRDSESRPFVSLNPSLLSQFRKESQHLANHAPSAGVPQISAVGTHVITSDAPPQRQVINPSYSTGRINQCGSINPTSSVVNIVNLDDMDIKESSEYSRNAGKSELYGTSLDERVTLLRKTLEQTNPFLMETQWMPEQPSQTFPQPNVSQSEKDLSKDNPVESEPHGKTTSNWMEDLLSEPTSESNKKISRRFCIWCDMSFPISNDVSENIHCPFCQKDMTKPLHVNSDEPTTSAQLETPEPCCSDISTDLRPSPFVPLTIQALSPPKATFYASSSTEPSPEINSTSTNTEKVKNKSTNDKASSNQTVEESPLKTIQVAEEEITDNRLGVEIIITSECDPPSSLIYDISSSSNPVSDATSQDTYVTGNNTSSMMSPLIPASIYDNLFPISGLADIPPAATTETQESSDNTTVLTLSSTLSAPVKQSSPKTWNFICRDTSPCQENCQLVLDKDGEAIFDMWNFTCLDPSLDVHLHSEMLKPGEKLHSVMKCSIGIHGKIGWVHGLVLTTKTNICILEWKDNATETREKVRLMERWNFSQILSIRNGLNYQWITVNLSKPKNRVVTFIMADAALAKRWIEKNRDIPELRALLTNPENRQKTDECNSTLERLIVDKFINGSVKGGGGVSKGNGEKSLECAQLVLVGKSTHSNTLLAISTTHLVFLNLEFVPLKSSAKSLGVIYNGIQLELANLVPFDRLESLKTDDECILILNLFSTKRSSESTNITVQFTTLHCEARIILLIQSLWKDIFKVDLPCDEDDEVEDTENPHDLHDD